MKEYNFGKMQLQLKKHLDVERFNHTLGVMYTSAALAMCYKADIKKAQAAGLLHDCAKRIPDDKMISMCRKQNIRINEYEKANPFLLHAKLGAFMAKEQYDIHDKEILSAIRYHTTGRPEMTLLEKIVYIADYIEPWRYRAGNLPEIRNLAFWDIDKALYMILKNTLIYLQKHNRIVDDMTEKAYNYYKELNSNRITDIK